MLSCRGRYMVQYAMLHGLAEWPCWLDKRSSRAGCGALGRCVFEAMRLKLRLLHGAYDLSPGITAGHPLDNLH